LGLALDGCGEEKEGELKLDARLCIHRDCRLDNDLSLRVVHWLVLEIYTSLPDLAVTALLRKIDELPLP
jgi:hypothetical protein